MYFIKHVPENQQNCLQYPKKYEKYVAYNSFGVLIYLFRAGIIKKIMREVTKQMSSLKMYNFHPEVKGFKLPDGFETVKFKCEADEQEWIDVCANALVNPENGHESFLRELVNIDGPDPYRDTYFIEKDGKKIATYTVVPNMWSTGMGYIHMVAVKEEYRGMKLGSFIADDSIKKLKEMGKEKIFLLTGDARIPALATYIKAGFLPVNYIDDQGKDMIERWQNVVNTLKLESLMLLDNDGNEMYELHCTI